MASNLHVTLKRRNATDEDTLLPKTTWAQVLNKPATFTPTSHSHSASEITSGVLADARIPSLAISKITNLQTALDGKANLSGATFTGLIDTPQLILRNPIQNFNPFSDYKIYNSIETNILAGKWKKLKVTWDGVENSNMARNITDQNYEQYDGDTPHGKDGDPDHVLDIDFVTNGLYGSSGITYAAGTLVFNFYASPFPSGWSCRWRNSAGIWTSITLTKNGNSQLVGTLPGSALYLTNIEITLSTGTGAPYVTSNIKWGLCEVEYFGNRMSLSQGALVSAVGGYMSGNLTTDGKISVGTAGDLTVAGQAVVTTNDARLTNARPASDVYAWAKASTRPSYTYSDVGAAAASHTHSPSSITTNADRILGRIGGGVGGATELTAANLQSFLGLGSAAYTPSTNYLGASGTAVDSDKLDGLDLNSTTRNNEVNKVMRTDASGYANFGWINTTSGSTTNAVTDVYVNTNDGYIRKKTLALFKTELGSMPPSSHTLDSHSNVVITTPSANQVLKYNGTNWVNSSDSNTNYYLSGVSGSGNGTVTFSRSGLSNLTWDASHTHSEYLPLTGGTLTGTLTGTTFVGALTGTASGNLTSASTLSASKLSGAIPSAVTATTQAVADNSTKIATTAYVKAQGYLTSLPTHTLSSHSDVSTIIPTTGQVLKWNGAAWAPSADNNTTYTLSSFGITASADELNYTDGVTSNIQTQLNGKAASSHSHAWSEITGTVPTWNQNTTGSASQWNGQSFYGLSTPTTGDVMRFSSSVGWHSAALTPSAIGAAEATHTHGTITSDGVILASGQATIASGDKLVFIDDDDGSKIKRATYSFDGSTTTFLRGDGQFATPTVGAASQVNIQGSSVTGDFNYIAMVKGTSSGQYVYVDSDIRFDGTNNKLMVGGYPLLRKNASFYKGITVNNRSYSEGYITTDDGIKIQWGTVTPSGNSAGKSVSFYEGFKVKFTTVPSITIVCARAASSTSTVVSAKIMSASTSGFTFIGSWAGASSTGFTPTAEEYTWMAIGY